MENPYLQLSYSQVGLSAMLILINGAISVLLKLGLERRLLLAALATVAQLVLIGFLLDWVFRLNRWYVVLALMVAMTLIALTTFAVLSGVKRVPEPLVISSHYPARPRSPAPG